jgi:hypothetical protein
VTEISDLGGHPEDRLGAGGRVLWDAVVADNELDAAQKVQLLEACRAKDRLDKLDGILAGDADTWARLAHHARDDVYEIRVDAALAQANATANQMKQLLAALRLVDPASGKRPQYRGPRGAQVPGVPGGRSGNVTAMDKFRTAAGG